jgi:hypothetical protein
MKILLTLAIVALAALATLSVMNFAEADAPEDTSENLRGSINAPSCGGSCSAGETCGSASCGATVGKSCGCSKR